MGYGDCELAVMGWDGMEESLLGLGVDLLGRSDFSAYFFSFQRLIVSIYIPNQRLQLSISLSQFLFFFAIHSLPVPKSLTSVEDLRGAHRLVGMSLLITWWLVCYLI